MAKTKREFILASCFLSGAAAVISFVCLGNQGWVSATTKHTDNDPTTDSINIGLFSGTVKQSNTVQGTYSVEMICAFDLNICALLCGSNTEDNLRKMYNNETVSAEVIFECAGSSNNKRMLSVQPRSTNDDKPFINAGLWLTTILFLIFSAVVGLFCTALSIWNTVANPYQMYFSIFALYIYNGIAAFLVLLAIILWGSLFGSVLTNNVPTYITNLRDDLTTKGLASLDYSYWLNLVSFVFYITSICLLKVRNYLISKEPKVNVQIEDSGDPVILLY